MISHSHVQNTASPANYQKIKKNHSSPMLHTVRVFSQYLQEHSTYTNSRTKYHLLFIAIKQHTQSIIPITYKYTASVYLKIHFL